MNSSYYRVPNSENTASESAVRRERRSYWLLGLAFLLVALASFKASQWSVVTALLSPSRYPAMSQSATSSMKMNGKCNVAYYVNWGIYGRKYTPSCIPAADLTHLLYAFGDLNPESGEVVLSDAWADKDIHYPGDSWNDSGNNLYGNLKAIYKLKKQHRQLKVLLSIGGWTYQEKFRAIVNGKPQGKHTNFANSVLKLIEDYGFDGADLDFEYPNNNAEADSFAALLEETRAKLSSARVGSFEYLLTIAAPCGPSKYQMLPVARMDKVLDLWNLMAYDFAGSWDDGQPARHQANLYEDRSPGAEPFSADAAIKWYISQGIAANKINMGLPLYGRSFMNTDGLNKPFHGVASGSWEAGSYDYRVLPLPCSEVYFDAHVVASWSYDPHKREMISFDGPQSAQVKGEYIKASNLGGAMFWELSGDKNGPRDGIEGGEGKTPVPGPSLVTVVKNAMGGLEQSRNNLKYPKSQFDNLRAGMP